MDLKNISLVLRRLDLPASDLFITGIAYDSRSVKPGNAFFCMSGEHFDGNQFIQEAINNGASCVFSEKESALLPIKIFKVLDISQALAMVSDYFFGNPSQHIRLLGVTGTNGKTTITHLIEHILNHAGLKSGLIGTLGTRLHPDQPYQEIRHTTPFASDLQQILCRMVEEKLTHVAMEVSSHALAQKRVEFCHFASACLTNITQDHLDFHLTMENYWMAKRRLFESLNHSLQKPRFAVVNADDPISKEFLKVLSPEISSLRYGWQTQCEVQAKSVILDARISRVSVSSPWGDLELQLKLRGFFNVYNALAALSVCLLEGVKLEDCAYALSEFTGVDGRFQIVTTGDTEPLCIVDYAHTPDGLKNILTNSRALVSSGGKLIVVFGCGGNRDASKRPQMGHIAESLADLVFITSDNPRLENPSQIITDTLSGIKQTGHIKVEPDRSLAIKTAISGASNKDVIVVAGKGHESYQILADRTIPFDDRVQVRLALEGRSHGN